MLTFAAHYQLITMRFLRFTILFTVLFISVFALFARRYNKADVGDTDGRAGIIVGADRLDEIRRIVGDKRVGLIVNHTSVLSDGQHLSDFMIANGFNVKKVFAPEHGFRGNDDAGAVVANGVDSKTGLPVLSVYGQNKKPSSSQMADIDVLIFDIQDVGTRFYTYISTMHYAMEAAAENDKEFIVLDRPNPNDFIDGPVRKAGFVSFVSVDPIPVLHGLTVGELAAMINGEGWIKTGANSCRLTIIPIQGWRHGYPYVPPVRPSPNLPDYKSIRLYPSLCFFEGTNISVGRGTKFPFKMLGNPDRKYGHDTFTPRSLEGYDTNPLFKGQVCYGVDLQNYNFAGGLSLSFIFDFYRHSGYDEKTFFKRARMFDLLAGTDSLRLQIIRGLSEDEIRAGWQGELHQYKQVRKKYLLYEDY